MKGDDMVFNTKRVFVAMICAVFIFGFSMVSTVAQTPDFGHRPTKKDVIVTITVNLTRGTFDTHSSTDNVKFDKHPKRNRHKWKKHEKSDELLFGIYKCEKKEQIDFPCTWVYYIPIGNNVLEITYPPGCTP